MDGHRSSDGKIDFFNLRNVDAHSELIRMKTDVLKRSKVR